MTDSLIENVSDTAFWVAHYRALESERVDALFREPALGHYYQDLVAPLPTVRPTILCAFVRQPSSPHFRVPPNGIACASARHN